MNNRNVDLEMKAEELEIQAQRDKVIMLNAVSNLFAFIAILAFVAICCLFTL